LQGLKIPAFGNECVRYSELAPFDGLIWPHL